MSTSSPKVFDAPLPPPLLAESDVQDAPAPARRARRRAGARSHTLSMRDLLALATGEQQVSPEEIAANQAVRPRTAADCAHGPRPCPWVGCVHNTFLDVNASGGLKLNHPGLEPGDIDPTQSCVLDRKDRSMTLLDVGTVMNLTRERVRQLERMALRRIAPLVKALHGL